jgi:hypothetical protein
MAAAAHAQPAQRSAAATTAAALAVGLQQPEAAAVPPEARGVLAVQQALAPEQPTQQPTADRDVPGGRRRPPPRSRKMKKLAQIEIAEPAAGSMPPEPGTAAVHHPEHRDATAATALPGGKQATPSAKQIDTDEIAAEESLEAASRRIRLASLACFWGHACRLPTLGGLSCANSNVHDCCLRGPLRHHVCCMYVWAPGLSWRQRWRQRWRQ